MADITPITTTSTSGYTNKARDSFYFDSLGTTAILDENRRRRLHSGQVFSWYFADVDNNEDFSWPRGAMACAFQANGTDDQVAALVSSTANNSIRFATAATNPKGWLHVLCRGTKALGGGTDESPVSKGTAGYVNPGRTIFLSDRNATPDTLTDASSEKRIKSKLGYKLQVFPFVTVDTSDTWLSESSGLCPGIVAVAWQAGTAAATGQVAVTQDASGDVVFTSASAGGTGWLWVWRARS